MPEIEEITYTPMGRNRFRCNQTREIVPRCKIKSHRRNLTNQRLGASKLKTKKPKVEVELTDNWGTCPKCKKRLWSEGGIDQCPRCGTKFISINPIGKSPMFHGLFSSYYAACAYCGKTNADVKAGNHECHYCHRTFIVY